MKLRILISLALLVPTHQGIQAKVSDETKKKIGIFLGTAATVAGAAGAAYYGYSKYKESQAAQGLPVTLDEATFDALVSALTTNNQYVNSIEAQKAYIKSKVPRITQREIDEVLQAVQDQLVKNKQQGGQKPEATASQQAKTAVDLDYDFDDIVYLFTHNKAYADIASQKNYIKSKYPYASDKDVARVINAVRENQKNPFIGNPKAFDSLVLFLSTDPKFASFDKIKEQKAFILDAYPNISLDVLGKVLGAVQDKLMENERPSASQADYEILGVSPNASKAEIRKAYLNRSRELHPDKHPKEEADMWTAKMKELNSAYERLK